MTTESSAATDPKVPLDQALRWAGSSDAGLRIDAAHALADHVEEIAAFEELVNLLDDDADTAVIETAVRSMITAGGRPGLLEVLKAFGSCDDNAADHIMDQLVELWFTGTPVPDMCRDVLDSGVSGPIRAGATEILDALTPNRPTQSGPQ